MYVLDDRAAVTVVAADAPSTPAGCIPPIFALQDAVAINNHSTVSNYELCVLSAVASAGKRTPTKLYG